MKRTIRKGLFETNSSSVHSLCVKVGSKIDTNIDHIYFDVGEFGWECEIWESTNIKASYINTLIRDCNLEEKFYPRIKEVLAKHNITCEFNTEKTDFYVDHSFEHIELLYDIFETDEKFLTFLLGEGAVITDNDNGGFSEIDCDPISDFKGKGYEVYTSNN